MDGDRWILGFEITSHESCPLLVVVDEQDRDGRVSIIQMVRNSVFTDHNYAVGAVGHGVVMYRFLVSRLLNMSVVCVC